MQSSMCPRPVLAVLATMLTGLAMAATAFSVAPVDHPPHATMPATGCPPSC
jgi:hypothetical protein